MSLFGYTNPDVFNYHKKENDEPLVFNTSIIKNMEITQETKDKSIDKPAPGTRPDPNLPALPPRCPPPLLRKAATPHGLTISVPDLL